MTFRDPPPRAILFDYGNTLIEFVARHADHCDRALCDAMARHLGPVDFERVKAIREVDRVRPYQGEHIENDLRDITVHLIGELYDTEPAEDVIDDLMRVRFDSFVEVIEAQPFVHELLGRLGDRYALGLVSNYPDGEAVRTSLGRTGLDRHLRAVVVSGEVGRVKPHPLPFTTALRQLGVEPADAIYIGDNWLGDIQGAKRLGMRAVWIKQYATLEVFEPSEGDHEPDLIIEHLEELERHLP